MNITSLPPEVARRMPLGLRRIARAWLDQEHLRAGTRVISDYAGQAILNARQEAAERAGNQALKGVISRADGLYVDDQEWEIQMDTRNPAVPIVHVRERNSTGTGEYQGSARMTVQLPLELHEADIDEPWRPVECDLTPLSMGCDPRAHDDMVCQLPRAVSVCRYETQGETRRAVGMPSYIREQVEAAGYVVVWGE